jgi:disulfide bond formation protein DsbB
MMTIWHNIKKYNFYLLKAPFKSGSQDIPSSPYFLVYSIIGIGLLSIALLLQYGGGFAPCSFCIFERWPYVFSVFFAILGLLIAHKRFQNIMLLLITLSYLTNVGLSAYHVAIEHKWVPAPEVCKAQVNTKHLSFEEFKKKILSAKIVPCDKVPLKVLGFSLVEYNFLITLIIFVFSLLLLRKQAQTCLCGLKGKKDDAKP